MKTIGFAGTAKNTGKTTTVLSVMAHCRALEFRLALTSIGFDGEQRDTITGLPKPRYLLQPGDWVATAAECLEAGSAGLRVLLNTDLRTILGNIVIAEVTHAGTVLVAGPNRQKDLESLILILSQMDIDLLLVDGAMNRLVPMIACDEMVLSTGAAYSPEIHKVAKQAARLVSLFELPLETASAQVTPGGRLVFEDGFTRSLRSGSLLEPIEFDLQSGSTLAKLILPGAINPNILAQFIDKGTACHSIDRPLTVVASSPLKIIASGHLEAFISMIESAKVQFKVLRGLPLLAVTACPFFPRWLRRGTEYEPAAVDASDLLTAMKNAIPHLPVYDIVLEPEHEWSGVLELERS